MVQPPRAARRCCAAPPAAHWWYGVEEVRQGAGQRAQLTESSAVHANASSAESGGGCCQHLRDALLQVGLTGAAASAGRGRSISPRGAAAWPSAVEKRVRQPKSSSGRIAPPVRLHFEIIRITPVLTPHAAQVLRSVTRPRTTTAWTRRTQRAQEAGSARQVPRRDLDVNSHRNCVRRT